MDVQVLKLRVKTENKIDIAIKTIQIYCLLKDIKDSNNKQLPYSHIEVLAYFMVYGFKSSTRDLILRSKIFNNPVSIDNALSKLRTSGLVVRVGVGLKTDTGIDDICEQLRFNIKDSLGFIIKLQNE